MRIDVNKAYAQITHGNPMKADVVSLHDLLMPFKTFLKTNKSVVVTTNTRT